MRAMIRRLLDAYDRAGAAVREYAEEQAPSKPETSSATVPDWLQSLLAHDEAQREAREALEADLRGRLLAGAARLAAAEARQLQIEEQARIDVEQAEIEAAERAWRFRVEVLGVQPS